MAELAGTKFDNVAKEYEDALSTIEHNTDMYEGLIDKIETRGYIVGKTMYNALISNEQANIDMLNKEYNLLRNTLSEAMKVGNIEIYSQQWYEMQGAIYDVEESLLDANTALIEYKNNLREVEWNIFDRTQDMLSEIQSEAGFLVDIMSNDKLFNEKGIITDKGQATLGLYATNYNAYMSQANDYADEILKINKELAKDPNNTTLLDRRKELLESQREMIESAEDEKQAIKDLYEDGYDILLDYMDKLSQKRMDMLNGMKDLYDYEKEVSEQTKEIGNLRKQLSAYQGDTSEETGAAIQQLKVDLSEAEENLRETEYDKYLSDQESMLNNMQTQTEEWVNERLDNIDLLVQTAVDSTNANAETIKATLESESDSVGYALTEAMNAIWSPGGTFGSVVATYNDNFDRQLTTVNDALEQIRLSVAQMVNASENSAKNDMNGMSKPVTVPKSPTTTTSTATTTSTPPKTTTTSPKPTSTTSTTNKSKAITVGGMINAKGAKIYKGAGGKGYTQYFKNDPIYKVIDMKGDYIRVRWHKAKSGSTGWFKKKDVKAYKTGGLVNETGMAWLDGTMSKPEMVLNSKDTENFIKLNDTLESIMSKGLIDKNRTLTDNDISAFRDSIMSANYSVAPMHVGENLPQSIGNFTNSPNVSVQIGDINMQGVNNPKEFAEQLKFTLQNNKTITKIIQSDTIGAMTGKNSLNKFKY